MKKWTKATIWTSLEEQAKSASLLRFQPTIDDRQAFQVSSSTIHLNYSKQIITNKTLNLLLALADTCCLRDQIQALMRGDKINISENRPALHTALRANFDVPIMVDQQNVMPGVKDAHNQMQFIAEQLRAQRWLGFSGKPISDIVNIGMGGSDLGPRLCLKVFADIAISAMHFHFISDADPTSFNSIVRNLNPETTLFIISSKSFSTQETLYNARKAMEWIGMQPGHEQHFIAVTAYVERAVQFGIKTILPIWNWVGGRYSFCSAINLITAIAIGFEAFKQILAGANSMDQHFLNADFSKNLPVLLALLGIWNNNFLHTHNLLMLTYTQYLEQFVPFIQQLDMESNGKSINIHGKTVNYATGPIIWGGSGNQAQHSYFQLLCQGTHKITADIISLKAFEGQMINQLCDANVHVLSSGVYDDANPYGFIPGNIPLNHILINDHSPFTIGALVALYEHKIFAQSVIWEINPFDQPGVESAKRQKKTVGQVLS